MIAVMQAYVDGKTIEARAKKNSLDWRPWPSPSWAWEDCDYLIATTPDTINWDHVSPEWQYMARDNTGAAFFYDTEPRKKNGFWSNDSECLRVCGFASYARGTVDWSESLVVRPS
jgi:hypothetical protein